MRQQKRWQERSCDVGKHGFRSVRRDSIAFLDSGLETFSMMTRFENKNGGILTVV